MSPADHPPPATTATPRPVPDRPARRAVIATFVANGLIGSSWVVRIPQLRDELGISDATVGWVLLAFYVGVVVALPLVGAATSRFGSRRTTAAGGVLAALTLPMVALANDAVSLAAVLILVGLGMSTMDVGMNAQGIGVERGYGRSIMVGLHAAWSIGAMLAAATGALLVATTVPMAWHLGVVGVVVAATTAACLPWLRVEDRVPREAATPGTRRGPLLALPTGVLVPVALVALGSSIGEVTAMDWSGLFLLDEVGVRPEQVGWGLVAYTTTLTVARLVGDRVADAIGPDATVSWGARLAAAAFVVMALAPTMPIALAGFALVAAGLAVTVPLCFARAGRLARSPGEGVAAVATVGYGGFLIAPPLVGNLKELTDLRVAFVVVAVIVGLLAGRRRPFGRGRPPQDGD